MNTLRCLLADDEPIARQILENYIKDIPNLQLIASCKNALEVMEVLQKESEEKFIFVKSDKKIIKLNFDDITHIEAYGNYIKIYIDTVILTPQTLSDFLEKLPDDFIRIHKSFVVNFKHLKLIDGNQFVLNTNVKLPIGKSYRKAITEKIG
ncbi:hypothetical protein GTQ40_05570 [Flavobacteriaceae bacterium R38]|nr:hypothetical protein [Flavobacteriaceae bacterium R38]